MPSRARRWLPVAVALAGCGGRPAAPPPAPVRAAPPAVASAEPPAPPAWIAPDGCHPDPPLTASVHAAFAALPPLAHLPPAAPPPISARGARRPSVGLHHIELVHHASPHNGAIAVVLPDPDPRHDMDCGFAEVLPRLGGDARAELEAFLARAPDSDPERALPHLARAARNGTPDAAFAEALALLRQPHGGEAALQVLAIATKALPATDAVGARARLEAGILDPSFAPGREAADLGSLEQAPLAWASVDSLLRLAAADYWAYRLETAIEAYAVAASITPDAPTRAGALAAAARIALEAGQRENAFAYVNAVASDAALYAALDKDRTTELEYTAETVIPFLPDGVLDFVARWRPGAAHQLLQDLDEHRRRTAQLRQIAGLDAIPLAPRPATAEDVLGFVEGCAPGAGAFDLRVTAFTSGPPEVHFSGHDAALRACLRETAAAYFELSTTSITAHVTVSVM